MIKKIAFSLMLPLLLAGCAQTLQKQISGTSYSYRVKGKTYSVLSSSRSYQAKGTASWYGPGFNRHRTASGIRYNMYQMTAAHKTLPLNSRVMVTNLKNHKEVIVKINDRGPFVGNRLIDVSYAAAKQLGMVGAGTVPVSIKAI